MPKEQSPGKPTTRRHSEQEKAAAVQMVRTLRPELGSDHGTVKRVAEILKRAAGFFGVGARPPVAQVVAFHRRPPRALVPVA